jgi:hypothetical protein
MGRSQVRVLPGATAPVAQLAEHLNAGEHPTSVSSPNHIDPFVSPARVGLEFCRSPHRQRSDSFPAHSRAGCPGRPGTRQKPQLRATGQADDHGGGRVEVVRLSPGTGGRGVQVPAVRPGRA